MNLLRHTVAAILMYVVKMQLKNLKDWGLIYRDVYQEKSSTDWTAFLLVL